MTKKELEKENKWLRKCLESLIEGQKSLGYPIYVNTPTKDDWWKNPSIPKVGDPVEPPYVTFSKNDEN